MPARAPTADRACPYTVEEVLDPMVAGARLLVMDDLLPRVCRRANAYAPYSGFARRCRRASASGRIHAGCNVENAAYPQGHAPRPAPSPRWSRPASGRSWNAVVIGGGDRSSCTPCGGCRQRLREFATPDDRRSISAVPTACIARDAGRAAADVLRAATSARRACAEAMRRRSGARRASSPQVAVVLGSGLGGFAEEVEDRSRPSPMASCRAFRRPSVPGHAGRLVLGQSGRRPVAVPAGPRPLYEGGRGRRDARRRHAPWPISAARPCCRPTPPAACGPTCRRAR